MKFTLLTGMLHCVCAMMAGLCLSAPFFAKFDWSQGGSPMPSWETGVLIADRGDSRYKFHVQWCDSDFFADNEDSKSDCNKAAVVQLVTSIILFIAFVLYIVASALIFCCLPQVAFFVSPTAFTFAAVSLFIFILRFLPQMRNAIQSLDDTVTVKWAYNWLAYVFFAFICVAFVSGLILLIFNKRLSAEHPGLRFGIGRGEQACGDGAMVADILPGADKHAVASEPLSSPSGIGQRSVRPVPPTEHVQTGNIYRAASPVPSQSYPSLHGDNSAARREGTATGNNDRDGDRHRSSRRTPSPGSRSDLERRAHGSGERTRGHSKTGPRGSPSDQEGAHGRSSRRHRRDGSSRTRRERRSNAPFGSHESDLGDGGTERNGSSRATLVVSDSDLGFRNPPHVETEERARDGAQVRSPLLSLLSSGCSSPPISRHQSPSAAPDKQSAINDRQTSYYR